MEDEFQNLFEDNFIEDVQAVSTEKLKDGERRIVSILFADISGFTKLSEKMDHEEVRDIIDKLFKLFTSSVEKHGGYVDKYAGDEIMALFGAKVASEVDTCRSISCGMDMLKKLDQFNQYIINDPKYNVSSENKLSMRVGINTGMVTTGSIGKGREGDFTVYGDVVNLASRMESNAPINRIMVPEKTMIQGHSTFSFSDYGEIDVKGFEDKVSVYLVDSAHDFQEKKVETPFLGSRENIDLLLDMYRSSSDSLDQNDRSNLCVVGIKGEAGIGKSRLISEFINTSSHGIIGKNVIRVASDSVVVSPYQTCISLIKKSLLIDRSDSKDTVLEKFNKSFDELSEVLDGELKNQLMKFKPRIGYLLGLKTGGHLNQLSGVDLRDEVQLSIRIFIQAICKQSNLSNVPFIIIMEDLQWIDSASLEVLSKIIDMESIGISQKTQENQALCFIFDYRDNYDVPAFISNVDTFKEIIIDPLTSDECGDMIRYTMSEDIVPEEVVKVLMKHSSGNPFFIEEWLKSLDQNIQWSSSDISSWISSIPDSMHSLVLSGVDTLENGPKMVLQCASVVGRRFNIEMIQQLEGKVDNLVNVSDSFETLKKNNFIVSEKDSEGSYTFKNALTRDVAYDSILKSNKSMLHGILADIIEIDYLDNNDQLLFQLANHYGRSDKIDKAKLYLVKGAKQSEETYNLYHANNLYKRAIQVYTSSDENLQSIIGGKIKNISDDDAIEFIRILHGYGNVLMLLSEMDECQQLFSSIIKVSDCLHDVSDLKCSLLGTIGKMYFRMGDYTESKLHFSKQLALAKEIDNFDEKCSAILFLAKIERAHGDYKNPEKVLSSLKDKISRNSNLLSQVLGELGVIYKNMGNLDVALDFYNQQKKICVENNYTNSLIQTLGNIGVVYILQKDNNRALDVFDEVLILNQEVGDKAILSKAHGNKGYVYRNLKKYEEALVEYKMQLKICEYSKDLVGTGKAIGNIGDVYMLTKKYEEAMDCFKKALEISKETGNKREEGIALANIGETLMAKGDNQESRDYLSKALAIFKDNGDKGLEKIIMDDISKLDTKL